VVVMVLCDIYAGAYVTLVNMSDYTVTAKTQTLWEKHHFQV